VARTTRRFLALLAATGTLLIAAGSTAAPVNAYSRPRPAAVDPGPVQIRSPGARHQYRFHLLLPSGARLKPLPSGQILVVDPDGTTIGAYDDAWAGDAQGQSVDTHYRVSGSTLIQTVAFDRRTRFPITLDPGYSSIATPGDDADPTAGPSLNPLYRAGSTNVHKVTVPAEYVYDPSLGYLHDYCTFSPDEFPAPAAPNADFRGPCARHDLCYAGSTDQFVCDNALRKDMYTNCDYYYSGFSLLRPLCKATADVYWAAVVIT
jgi:hypothetical protein